MCEVVYKGNACSRDAKWILETDKKACTNICSVHKNSFVKAYHKFANENYLYEYFSLGWYATIAI